MNYDLFNEVDICQLADTATKTSTLTTSAVNVAGYESADFIWSLGASGDTLSGSVYWTLVIEESNTYNTGFTAVATADVVVDGTNATANSIVANATTEDQQAYHIGYIGNKKYVRMVATATGTHTYGTPMAAIAVLGHRKIGASTNTMVAVATA